MTHAECSMLVFSLAATAQMLQLVVQWWACTVVKWWAHSGTGVGVCRWPVVVRSTMDWVARGCTGGRLHLLPLSSTILVRQREHIWWRYTM